jgi:hypothetical protein
MTESKSDFVTSVTTTLLGSLPYTRFRNSKHLVNMVANKRERHFPDITVALATNSTLDHHTPRRHLCPQKNHEEINKLIHSFTWID